MPIEKIDKDLHQQAREQHTYLNQVGERAQEMINKINELIEWANNHDANTWITFESELHDVLKNDQSLVTQRLRKMIIDKEEYPKPQTGGAMSYFTEQQVDIEEIQRQREALKQAEQELCEAIEGFRSLCIFVPDIHADNLLKQLNQLNDTYKKWKELK